MVLGLAIKEILSFPFYSRLESADLLKLLFDRKALWEKRGDRGRGEYRNCEWYTVGCAVYLDGLLGVDKFMAKADYWNEIYINVFNDFTHDFSDRLSRTLNSKINYLSHSTRIGFPGFHIFTGQESAVAFFGHHHTDLQWKNLHQIPDFKFKQEDMEQHYSFTIPLMLPYLGGGMYLNNGEEYFKYEENKIYVHDGNATHAIAPFFWPVLPTDYRISIQCHGFKIKDTIYIYW